MTKQKQTKEQLISYYDFLNFFHHKWSLFYQGISWKTNFTSTMLYYLYLVNQNYNFIVIDPKWDLGAFKNADRIKYAHFNEDMIKLLEETNSNMEFINKKIQWYLS